MNIPFEKFEALLFDLDGTIIHSMPIHMRAWNEALEDKRPLITDELLQEYAGVSTLKMVQLLNQKYSWNLDPQTFPEKKEAIFLKYIDQLTLIKPIYEIILQFSSSMPMAIVSGGPRANVLKLLSHFKIDQYFKVVVCAEDTVLGKPHPDPFLKAAELLQVKPKKCLVFEDGEAGIVAAKSSGMSVVKVDLKQELSFLGLN